MSANGNEESTGEICHSYFLVVNAITLYSCTIKLQYILLGDYWECVRPARLPVLTRVTSSVLPGNSYELRPPWEQHLRHVPHRVRNGYDTVNVLPLMSSVMWVIPLALACQSDWSILGYGTAWISSHCCERTVIWQLICPVPQFHVLLVTAVITWTHAPCHWFPCSIVVSSKFFAFITVLHGIQAKFWSGNLIAIQCTKFPEF